MVRRILTSSDDWLKDIPELSSSNEVKITPMVSGAIPVTVSGDSGVKVSGLFDPSFILKVDGDLVVVRNLTIIKNESTSNITSPT